MRVSWRLMTIAAVFAMPLAAEARIAVSVPDHGPVMRVVDGCPPGYARDLMADCRLVRRPPPRAGHGLPYEGNGRGNGISRSVAPARVMLVCPRGYHMGSRGDRCWPDY